MNDVFLVTSEELPNNDYNELRTFFWSRGDLPIMFTSDKVTSENHWHNSLQVIKKSLFTITGSLYYFLHAILCPEHTIPLKKSLIAHFAIVTMDDLLLLSILMSSQLICNITRTPSTGIVTLYSSVVLARANWHKGDLHQWITTDVPFIQTPNPNSICISHLPI